MLAVERARDPAVDAGERTRAGPVAQERGSSGVRQLRCQRDERVVPLALVQPEAHTLTGLNRNAGDFSGAVEEQYERKLRAVLKRQQVRVRSAAVLHPDLLLYERNRRSE